MEELTNKQRGKLDRSQFAIPDKAPGPGSYPIPDEHHARVALSYVMRYGSATEQSQVRRAVARKYPNIEIGK